MVKDNSKTPHICLKIAWFVLNDLRGHKRNGAGHFINALVLFKFGRHSKVSNLDRWLSVNVFYEYVEMLDVTMNNFRFMHVTQAFCHLQDNHAGEAFTELIGTKLFHEAEQVTTLDILSGQVNLISVLKLVNEGHNMWAVLAEAHSIGLTDLLLTCEALVLARIYYLESHFDADWSVNSQPDWIGRALTDHVEQLILVKLTRVALTLHDGEDASLSCRFALQEDLSIFVCSVDEFDWVP